MTPPAMGRGEIRRRLSHNVWSTMVSRGLYLGSRVFLPPLILSYVSLETYGIWATCFVVIGYLGIGGLGANSVYIHFVARYHAEEDTARIDHLLSTGLVLMGSVSLLLLVGVWFALPALVRVFAIPAPLWDLAYFLFLGTALGFLLELSLGAFSCVLRGLQEFVRYNILWLTSTLLETLLAVVLLVAGFGIYSLLVGYLIRNLVTIVGAVWLCRRLLPSLRVSWRLVDRDSLRLFLGFGAITQLSASLAMLSRSLERLLPATLLSMGAVGMVDLATKFPGLTGTIAGSFNGALQPTVAYLHYQQRRDEVVSLYLQSCRHISLLTGLALGFLASFAGPLMVFWLGGEPRFQTLVPLVGMFCLAYHLQGLTGPGSAVYRGSGEPARELVYPLLQLGFSAVLVALLAMWRGLDLLGLIAALTLATGLAALVYLWVMHRRFGIPGGDFLRRVLLPGALPYGLAALLRWIMAEVPTDRWQALWLLGPAGLAYGSLAVLLGLALVLDREERDLLIARLPGRLRRGISRDTV